MNGFCALTLLVFLAAGSPLSWAQSLGSAGTIHGTVTDPSGAVVAGASVEIHNPITSYTRQTKTGMDGRFQFGNVPPNPYHLQVSMSGFRTVEKDVVTRGNVPISLQIKLPLAGESTSVTVEASSADMVENVPYAHNDLDQSVYSKLPTTSPGSGLTDAVTLGTPGVVADSNGLFHPLGDHAQTTFSIDGQPISDQQSKQFSTQIPLNAIQSMELITGSPNAEFGDKTSLVVNATTRSGLGLAKPTGSFRAQYGSFGTVGEEATFGIGGPKIGNFLVANALRSGRFLDTPEFRPIHAAGNSGTVFDRLDWQPRDRDTFHLDLLAARNWFQTPNTYDQPLQDQRQKVFTFNVAPAYLHTFNATTLLSINAFIRQDRVNYYPSNDIYDDTPVTIGQQRRLTNYGLKADVAMVRGRHDFKTGIQLMQTRLDEAMRLGITASGFNAVCVNGSGGPLDLPSVTNPGACAALGFAANPDLHPGLIPYDLTRGGSLFRFAGRANVNQFAWFAQDAITLGHLSLTAGLRVDRYNGLSSAASTQPRVGAAYLIKRTGTVLRGAYSRTLETPYNENLILSSSTGSGGLAQNVFGGYGAEPIQAGRRNQFNTGIQQAFDKVLTVDADYFWKFTDNAFDFGTLLNTPIVFPISWRKSKIDGVAVRFSTPDLHGFQGFTTLGHTRARYFGPSNGGLLFNSPLDTGVFRIDHDQAFQQTTHLRYQRKKNGWWVAWTWRYDSGMVAGAVNSLGDALALTGAQQAAIGFYCGSRLAAPGQPITACDSSNYGATRLNIPAPGSADDDHNPPRIAPRHLFDIGFGTDSLYQRERFRVTLNFTVANLTNSVSLYNFLSTFSGTHFAGPRTYQAELGFAF
ncbi:MAG: TonB-dependent receptor [Bryobacterales bacterium]|nr:TonB-dependent receptor [Bryobacterales bacterium]